MDRGGGVILKFQTRVATRLRLAEFLVRGQPLRSFDLACLRGIPLQRGVRERSKVEAMKFTAVNWVKFS